MATATCIRTHEELDAAFDRSREKPVYLFKHSLTCPVSRYGWMEFEAFVSESSHDDADYVYIEIQKTRELSNAVAERTRVKHESPQVLRIVDGACEWNDSHGAITVDALRATMAPS